MSWKTGDPLPYDGWYNGNYQLQIDNGTFEDFLPKHEQKVKYGLEKEDELKKWKKEWESIPLDERIRRRNVVIEDSTPRYIEEVNRRTGVVTKRIGSQPSNNNNVDPEKYRGNGVPREKKPNRKAALRGLLTKENSPLTEEQPELKYQGESSAVPAEKKTHPIFNKEPALVS